MKPIHPKRKTKEIFLYKDELDRKLSRYFIYKIPGLKSAISLAITISSLKKRGMNNALNIEAITVEFTFPNLPIEFDGIKILFLSDLHTDSLIALPEKILEAVKPLEYSYAVLGGDYLLKHKGDTTASEHALEEIIKHLVSKSPVYAILGNHDAYETGLFLERIGVHMLMNEFISLEKGGKKIYIAGVDDYWSFEAAEFDEADRGIPENAFKIMVSHSPGPFREIESRGYALCLSGHTHGGQICLPGGIPVIRAEKVPRKMSSGKWQYNRLKGYTSRGIGSSFFPARFFCMPEVTVITLKKG